MRRLIFSFRARFSGQTRQKKRDHSPLSADHGLFLYIVGLHLSDVGLSAKSSAASSLETPWMTLHTPIIIPYSLRKIGRTLDHRHHNLFGSSVASSFWSNYTRRPPKNLEHFVNFTLWPAAHKPSPPGHTRRRKPVPPKVSQGQVSLPAQLGKQARITAHRYWALSRMSLHKHVGVHALLAGIQILKIAPGPPGDSCGSNYPGTRFVRFPALLR